MSVPEQSLSMPEQSLRTIIWNPFWPPVYCGYSFLTNFVRKSVPAPLQGYCWSNLGSLLSTSKHSAPSLKENFSRRLAFGEEHLLIIEADEGFDSAGTEVVAQQLDLSVQKLARSWVLLIQRKLVSCLLWHKT